MKRALVVLGALALLGAALLAIQRYRAEPEPIWFEARIRDFEASDRANPPEPGAIVFVGSSSIVRWKSLAEDMAPLRVLNRGFGGSQLSHAVFFARRIVTPYRPKAVVLYEGDNDVAYGKKSAERIFDDFQRFVAIVQEEVPEARIYFVSIKPSPLRWELWPEMHRANALIEAFIRSEERLGYIDISAVLLGPDGRPREALFVRDGLHLNAAGYSAWTAAIKPVLEREVGG